MNTPPESAPPMTSAREAMVQSQIQRRGIVSQRVLEAVRQVPREEFIGSEHRRSAYADRPLPIGHGQTISQPYTVAFMCEAAQLNPQDKVLEIGTGSGYGAAVLSRLCRQVHSVERIPELEEQARERLCRLGYANVTVHLEDGSCGLVTEAPFDAIVVTAAAQDVPRALLEQLELGGRLIIPTGTQESQTMLRITHPSNQQFIRQELGRFAFVPLVGKFGWPQNDYS